MQKEKKFDEIIEMIEQGLEEYKTYVVQKSGLSNEQVKTLNKRWNIKEIYLTDELANDIEGVGDEGVELSWMDRWHYQFSNF